jgi:dihydroorotate dehydrogenase
MPVPYALIKPLFFAMDPEVVHDLTVSLLEKTQRTPWARLYRQPRIEDPLRLCGLNFPNRVGLAAGLDKNARCIDAWSSMGFGFVEVGTVTPRPQAGNPKPRIFRLPQERALINRLGFNNEGTDRFVHHIGQSHHLQRPTSSPVLLGLNIGKNATTPIEEASQDYLLALEAVYAYADYVTINISSPNTKNLRSLQSDEALFALLTLLDQKRSELAAQSGRRVPMMVKIAPDMSEEELRLFALTLKRLCPVDESARQGMWGVIATNTTLNKERVAHLPPGDEAGGLSGAPLTARSCYTLRQLRMHLGVHFPLIGVGGIMGGDDAVEKINAGADCVQLYSGLIYQGPELIKSVAQALKNQPPQPTAPQGARPV